MNLGFPQGSIEGPILFYYKYVLNELKSQTRYMQSGKT